MKIDSEQAIRSKRPGKVRAMGAFLFADPWWFYRIVRLVAKVNGSPKERRGELTVSSRGFLKLEEQLNGELPSKSRNLFRF